MKTVQLKESDLELISKTQARLIRDIDELIINTDFKCPRDISNLMSDVSLHLFMLILDSLELDSSKEKDIKVMQQIAFSESVKIHNTFIDFIDYLGD